MTERYEVRAVRWEHGWELHIDGVGVTQARSLASAERQVLDYAATLTGTDADDAVVVVHPEARRLEALAAET
jgi:hypothetical protein